LGDKIASRVCRGSATLTLQPATAVSDNKAARLFLSANIPLSQEVARYLADFRSMIRKRFADGNGIQILESIEAVMFHPAKLLCR